MKRIVSIALLIVLFVSVIYAAYSLTRPPAEWAHYHNYSEIVAMLFALNETHSDVVDVFSIGKSSLSRDIYAARLTNESDQEPKPEVLFVGYHHAAEQITSELTLYFVVYAATHFGLNKTVTELLNRSEIYVVVALNVDGFDLFEKNGYQRNNANGVDLNRNYGYEWTSELWHGELAFSEPETQAVRDFVFGHHFVYALSFHSGVELILYPWSYTQEAPQDAARFNEISEDLSKATGGTLYEQSSLMYISCGTWDDWMYGVAGVFALTIEIFGSNQTLLQRPVAPYDARTKGLTDRSGFPQGESEFEIRYAYNPLPGEIEAVILRWLPAFFYVTNRTISEASLGAE